MPRNRVDLELDGSERITDAALSTLAVRSAGGHDVIEGYAARYDELSEELAPDVREVILPGAFTEALRTSDPVALFDHDTGKLLGRASAGTLRLREDARGLWVEIDPPRTQAGRETLELIRRGDVRGQSIRFRGHTSRWEMRGSMAVHIVESIGRLVDVGPVTLPAYPTTSVEVTLRSLEAYREEQGRLARQALRARLEALGG